MYVLLHYTTLQKHIEDHFSGCWAVLLQVAVGLLSVSFFLPSLYLIRMFYQPLRSHPLLPLPPGCPAAPEPPNPTIS